jgi:hypothetical protein
MAKEKTTSAPEVMQEEAPKKVKGKTVDKGEIVDLISQLPLKERMDLIRDLQTVVANDADAFSVGNEGVTTHYDTLRDGYHKKAKRAEETK